MAYSAVLNYTKSSGGSSGSNAWNGFIDAISQPSSPLGDSSGNFGGAGAFIDAVSSASAPSGDAPGFTLKDAAVAIVSAVDPKAGAKLADQSKYAKVDGYSGLTGLNDVFTNIGNGVNSLIDDLNIPNTGLSNSGGSVSGGSASAPPNSAVDYLNADLSKHYGMDAYTAWTEAMSNTAHQREVADLQAAGLNPVLSVKQGGSSVVSPNVATDSSAFGAAHSTSPLETLKNVASMFTSVKAIASAISWFLK